MLNGHVGHAAHMEEGMKGLNSHVGSSGQLAYLLMGPCCHSGHGSCTTAVDLQGNDSHTLEQDREQSNKMEDESERSRGILDREVAGPACLLCKLAESVCWQAARA